MSLMQWLLKPKSVAVVGASADPKKLTGRPIGHLLKHQYSGEIFAVNPRSEMIGDIKCYAEPKDLPKAPDLALVLLGADRVNGAVRQLSAIGTKAAVVLASGFGEAGEIGRRRQAELREAAGDMRILGPNTIGMANLTDGIMLTASGAMDMDEFPSGPVGLVSQSGGILGSLLSRGVGSGIGFSKLIATGNECDLEVSDFIDGLADDDSTRVISLYLETIRNPEKFRQAAQRAMQAGKQIVAYKVGRSESGARSAVSHTGALAGADEVYGALFEQLGIIRASTLADLLDIPSAIASGRRMAGKRVAIVTSTGGAATIVADNVGLAGLEMPTPDPDTAAKLLAHDLTDAALDTNPIDVTLAGLRPELFRSILSDLSSSSSYDAIIIVVGSSSIGQPDVVAGPLLDTMDRTDKPLLAYVSPNAPNIVKHLNRNGVPAFAAPESCATALLALQPFAAPAGPKPHTRSTVDCSDVPSGALNEAQSKQLFARFTIPITREVVAPTPEEVAGIAETFGAPVALKILSGEILHKSEVGGVAIGIPPEEAATNARAMLERVRKATSAKVDGILVQEMVKGGVEMILGFNRDPQLGPYLLLGAGGITTELYQDVALRLLPIDHATARSMVAELKCSALLNGFRGRPVADSEALVDAIVAFGEMALALGPRLEDAEINPLFVLPQGEGVVAADGLVVLS
jgi:acyl-CoA synthetase (NDP forming)